MSIDDCGAWPPSRGARSHEGDGPEVHLLDARELGVDEVGLRTRARELGRSMPCSRSYRYPYALVAWHTHPVGVDIERLEPCQDALAATICTPQELLRIPASPVERAAFLISLWSSKEALTKALGDALDYDPRRLDAPLSWREGRSGPWRARSLAAPAGHVAWLCWRVEP